MLSCSRCDGMAGFVRCDVIPTDLAVHRVTAPRHRDGSPAFDPSYVVSRDGLALVADGCD